MRLSRPILAAAGWAVAVAALGGAMSRIGPWYRSLEQPALKPPDWAFAPAWTLIFALAATAAVFGWRHARTNAERAGIVSLFFVNGVLNVVWSAVFFTLRRPDWGLAEVAALWLSVLALIVWHARFSRQAAVFLAPYLVWVTFAAWLNWEVVRLNAPFG